MRFNSRSILMFAWLIMDTKAETTINDLGLMPPTTTSTTETTTTFFTTTPSTTTTTIPSTTTTTTTTSQASVSHVVSTPTTPTSNSTPTVNGTETTESSAELAVVKVGVGVGLGIGLPLIIVIVVLAVINVRLKQQLRKQRLLLLKTNQIITPSKDQLQQKAADAVIQELSDFVSGAAAPYESKKAAGGFTHELSDVVGDPYESLSPRSERTATDSLHVYQALNHSTNTDI